MTKTPGEPEDAHRALAYQLWEKAGRPEGRQDEFWQQAESQLALGKRKVPHDDLDKAGEGSFPASDPVNRT